MNQMSQDQYHDQLQFKGALSRHYYCYRYTVYKDHRMCNYRAIWNI